MRGLGTLKPVRLLSLVAMAVCLTLAATAAFSQGAALFAGADLALGSKLIAQHKCDGCHANSVGGDGSDMYNPKGRVNTAARLKAMVEACDARLNLKLFPEELDAIAGALNRDHYKFSK
jgi:hypothetical protein